MPDLQPVAVLLRDKIPNYTGCIVAREQHKDGHWHIHAVAYAADGTVISNARQLDINGKHCNMQAARNPNRVTKYCTKDGDWISDGDINKPNEASETQPKLTNAEIGKRLLAGETLRSLVDEHPELIVRYDKIQRAMLSYELDGNPPERDVKAIWIWGPSGIGKSRSIWTKYGHKAYWAGLTGGKWFDGYNGQAVVVFDDYDASRFQYHELLRLLDRYPLRVEVKGGYTTAKWTVVCITSVNPPQQVYPNKYDQQLARRITAIELDGSEADAFNLEALPEIPQ